jgi:cell division septation protein DedD
VVESAAGAPEKASSKHVKAVSKPEPAAGSGKTASSRKPAATTAAKTSLKKPVPTRQEKPEPRGHYAVQVEASQDKSRAGLQVDLLKKNGYDAYLEPIDLGAKGRFFRVMVGPYGTEAEAKKVRTDLVRDSRFSESYIRYLP